MHKVVQGETCFFLPHKKSLIRDNYISDKLDIGNVFPSFFLPQNFGVLKHSSLQDLTEEQDIPAADTCQSAGAVSRREQWSQVCFRTKESSAAARPIVPPDSHKWPIRSSQPQAASPGTETNLYGIANAHFSDVQNKNVHRQVRIAGFCFWKQ